jgi:hypothetical protein
VGKAKRAHQLYRIQNGGHGASAFAHPTKRVFGYGPSMKTQPADIDELDRRWKAFLAQKSVATNEDVTLWLRTWGTPAFRDWQSLKSAAPFGGRTE